MKTKNTNHQFSLPAFIILLIAMLATNTPVNANYNLQESDQPATSSFELFKGKIIDSKTGIPLIFSTLSIEGTNIASVCNSEGEFAIKIPKDIQAKNLTASYIGYKNKTIPISSLSRNKNRIELEELTVSLAEVNVFPNDPAFLIEAVLKNRLKNYMQEPTLMTAFYRETIKKRRTYVSLSEAIVEVSKKSYSSFRNDQVKLFKGRKSTDYEKMDTLTFKLQGGPYTSLLLDVMKDPTALLTENYSANYNFKIANITRIDDHLIYVLEFIQKEEITEPLYYGKLYIDSESLAITSAAFSLNTKNKAEAGAMFIKRKPMGATVYPTIANYLVNYREKNGKWYFGYSRANVDFKVDWDKKLFNTNYSTVIEMAVTDWKPIDNKPFKGSDRLKMNVIMEETISGFAD